MLGDYGCLAKLEIHCLCVEGNSGKLSLTVLCETTDVTEAPSPSSSRKHLESQPHGALVCVAVTHVQRATVRFECCLLPLLSW